MGMKERKGLRGWLGRYAMVTLATRLPQPSVAQPSLPSLFLKGFSFLMSLLLREGAHKVLKYPAPGFTSSRTIQTCLYFQYHLVGRGKSDTETRSDQVSLLE